MARKERKNFSKNIKPKELTFTDEYFKLSGSYINTDYGFNYIAYNALKDVNDVKSNNYSNIILTKKQNMSNLISINEIAPAKTKDFISALSFFAPDNSNTYNQPVWLSFDKTYDSYDIDMESASIKLIKSNNLAETMLFRVNCINEQYCYISHNFGSSTFYLSYDGSFKYTTKFSDSTCRFTYHLVDNKLNLYILYKGILYLVYCEKNKNGYYLSLSPTAISDNSADIYINDKDEYTNKYIDSTWIRYKRNNAVDIIDSTRSSLNNSSQIIIHNEYSDDKVNVIPLKNTLTYQGTVTDGQVLRISSNGKFIDEPMVDFRNYTSLHTGYNQELGTENITLSFTFTDQVIRLNDGEDCIISIPSKNENDLSPLYPYEAININDMAFVRNGAFSSDVPFFADKFRKLQNESEYSGINNYTYLCTWLYQPNEYTTPVWLDRYYYPDMISRKDALKQVTNHNIFNLSFENILDKFYLKDEYTAEEREKYGITPEVDKRLKEFKTKLKEETFIDKKSDLLFAPGTKYQYSRISKNTVDEIFDSLKSNRSDYVKDKYSNDVLLSNLTHLNGTNWEKLPANFFQNSQQISFNTNIFISPYKKMGIQLFGMEYKKGFNIQNRKDLTPFTYYATDDSVFMMNNSFNICNQFNIKEKYNENILYIIISAPFDDVYVISENYIFIFDYDLSLKNQILISSLINETNIPFNGTMLSKVYMLQHNKNLYAVYNEEQKDDNDISYHGQVVKLIFNPDFSYEKENSIRILQDDEFFNNFTVSKDNSLSQTDAIIKSLYIDSNNILYAFNYDVLKIAHDNDTIYGIIKENNNKNDSSWYYIFNQSLATLNTSIAASKYAEFVSDVSIDNLAFGPNGVFALIRGFNSESNNYKTLEVYDKSKTKVYNYPLKSYDKVISLDYYRYIDSDGEEHDSIFALVESDGSLTVIEYQIDGDRVKTYNTSLPGKYIPTFKNITNSNLVLPYLNKNSLYFNLNLPENNGCISYEWDLNEAQEGWYNINVMADLNEAVYEIKINDITVAIYNTDNTPNFKKHLYTNISSLDGIYYLGTLGKQYGTTLNEILKGNSYIDPYAWKNSKIEYTTIYNKILKYHEYQANKLHFTDINQLVLTIPCGIRNGIEEIVRYFKFNRPPSHTNKIKINISGLKDDIIMDSEINNLKRDIVSALNESDCLIEIKEIEFI